MSKHLIQPIEVVGILSCIAHGASGYSIGYAPWRTNAYCQSEAENLGISSTGDEDDDQWLFDPSYGDPNPSLLFAVSCISGIDFTFTTVGGTSPGVTDIEIFVNGVIADAGTIHADAGDGPTSWSYSLTLDPDRACGSIIEIAFSSSNDITAHIDIDDVN